MLARCFALVVLCAPAMACVDGKTPDCSGDAAICGYDVPDAPAPPIDAPADAPPADAVSDAPVQDTGTDGGVNDAADAKAG